MARHIWRNGEKVHFNVSTLLQTGERIVAEVAVDFPDGLDVDLGATSTCRVVEVVTHHTERLGTP